MAKLKKFYAFTPGGSMCYETGASTRRECIKKLLETTSHMPYKNWKQMERRGYTIAEVEE